MSGITERVSWMPRAQHATHSLLHGMLHDVSETPLATIGAVERDAVPFGEAVESEGHLELLGKQCLLETIATAVSLLRKQQSEDALARVRRKRSLLVVDPR